MTTYNILIADDEIQARKLINLYLMESNVPCQIIEAQDGNEVLDLIQSDVFDIVFLDIKMPSLSGIEILGLRKKNICPPLCLLPPWKNMRFLHLI